MDITGIAKSHHAGIPKASSKKEWKLSDSLRERIAEYAGKDAAQNGVRVYEDRFEWLLNLSPDAGGGLDDAGSPVYFKKITVTPDDERAWFRKHPQWSKSNRYAELEVWIFI